MFCGMVTIGGARGLHDRRSGRSVVGSRLLLFITLISFHYSNILLALIHLYNRHILLFKVLPYVSHSHVDSKGY